MKCPYCDKDMKTGTLSGDSRTKVRWQASDEKIKFFDKMISEKGCIDAKYTIFEFQVASDYCDNCNKIIINTKVKK